MRFIKQCKEAIQLLADFMTNYYVIAKKFDDGEVKFLSYSKKFTRSEDLDDGIIKYPNLQAARTDLKTIKSVKSATIYKITMKLEEVTE